MMISNYTKITYILFFISINTNNSIANQDVRTEAPTIPVMINKGYKVITKTPENLSTKTNPKNSFKLYSQPQALFPYGEYPSDNTIGKFLIPQNEEHNIAYTSIGEKIKSVRKYLCEVNENGSFEVWFEFTVSGGVFVSASGQSGLKAIINCGSAGLNNK